MIKSIILSLDKGKITQAVMFAMLVAIASLVPLYHNQLITGPIVNATLFLAVMFLNAKNALLIGLIPSLIALSAGLLPAVLAPMIPFIMMSNAILILTFDELKKHNYWLAVFVSSFLKFLFLYSTSTIVINLIIKKELASQVAYILSWPQFATALAGGVIAFGLGKIIKKT